MELPSVPIQDSTAAFESHEVAQNFRQFFDSADVDSVTGEPSLLHAYLNYASSLHVSPDTAFGLALSCWDDKQPSASSAWSSSACSEAPEVISPAVTDGKSEEKTNHSSEISQCASSELNDMITSGASGRYNRGYFLRQAGESGLDPLDILRRVVRLISSPISTQHLLDRATGVWDGGLPLRLLEPASPQLQRLLSMHAAAVQNALLPPTGMEHPEGTHGSPSSTFRSAPSISALEASILGIQQARSGPSALLMPSAASYDGMHLTMAGLCAALVAFEHGLDFARSPRHFPVLMACHTQLQTHATKLSPSTSSRAHSTEGMSVSSQAVNDSSDSAIFHSDSDFTTEDGGSSAASVSGPTDQSTQQKSASRSDRSPGACIVPLAVLFSRFPHLPRLFGQATDEDAASAKAMLQQFQEQSDHAERPDGRETSGGHTTSAVDEQATGAFSSINSGTVSSIQQGVASPGLRTMMREHLHALPQPVLQVVFRPAYTAKYGHNTLFAASGVPLECFANEAMCRVSGIRVQDVVEDSIGGTAARHRIFLWLDAHPQTQLARALAAIAACAGGHNSYQFEGMFLRYNHSPPIGGQQPPLHTSSMYGVETRHMERTPGGGIVCATSYLSDLVMARESKPVADMDLPGNELRTMEALLLHPEKFPDLRRAMRVLNTGDPATAMWRSLELSCRRLAVRAVGLVRKGRLSAPGCPFRAVESVIGSIVTQLMHAHVQRGGGFPPSAAEINSLMDDPLVDAHLQHAFQAVLQADKAQESAAAAQNVTGTAAATHSHAAMGSTAGKEGLFEEKCHVQAAAGVEETQTRPAWDADMRYQEDDVQRVRPALSSAIAGGLLKEIAREALSQVTVMLSTHGIPGTAPPAQQQESAAAGPSTAAKCGASSPPAEQLGMSLQIHVGREAVRMQRALQTDRMRELVLSLAATAARASVRPS